MYLTLSPLPRNLLRSGIVLIFLLPLLSVCYLVPTRAAANPTATPLATASLTAGTERTDSFGIKQVYVPAGCFMMGSDPSKDTRAPSQEQPQHQVCITKGYWFDEFPVTNVAFDAFVNAGGYSNDSWWSSDGLSWRKSNKVTGPSTKDLSNAAFGSVIDCTQYSSQPNQPRICVSYYEAEAYARWRTCRLPTEAEWEYAAHGTTGWIYPWGDIFDESKAHTIESDAGRTTVVDAYPTGKSWIGAYDMAGNVFQWVSDWYSDTYYNTSPTNDPTGPISGQSRAIRGGGLVNDSYGMRAAFRNDHDPAGSVFYISFRVVCSIPVQ